MLRFSLMLFVFACAAVVTPLRAQQAVSAAEVPFTSAPARSPALQVGPRVTPRFQSAPVVLVDRVAARSSSSAEGGQHTIVISTLALVLAVVVIVLLVAR